MIRQKWNYQHVLVLIMSLGLSACVYMPSQKSQMIQEFREPPKNMRCVLLGCVDGISYYSFVSSGLEIAKARAKVKAANIGGTHVQWLEQCTGIKSLVTAKVYRCEALPPRPVPNRMCHDCE